MRGGEVPPGVQKFVHTIFVKDKSHDHEIV